MADFNTATRGNLALQMDATPKARFTVISGGRVDGPRACAPCRHASSSAAEPKGSRLASAAAAAVIVAVCAILAFTSLVSRAQAVTDASLTASTQVVSVRAGESLWSLAESHPIDGLTTQETSDIIREWNGLESATLHMGEELVVPL